MPFSISDYSIAPDSRSLAFVTTEPSGTRTIPVLYTIQQDGRRLTRVLAGGGAGGDGDDDAPAGGGRGGGLSDLAYHARRPHDLFPRGPRRLRRNRRTTGRAAAEARRRVGRRVRPPTPPRQLHAARPDRPGRTVEADVRRRLADDEVPLLRSEDARPRLGRDEGEVRAARRSRRRPAGAAQHHQRDDRRAECLAHGRGARRRPAAAAACRQAISASISSRMRLPDATR